MPIVKKIYSANDTYQTIESLNHNREKRNKLNGFLFEGVRNINNAIKYNWKINSFIYSKDKGVLKIDTTNSKLSTVAKTDDDWGEVTDIYGFAGNIYLLDQTSNQIWKYLPTSGGYSDKREYLSKGTKVDFSSALRMQIESSIYVLKEGGEILRFTKGVADNFSLSGLDKGVKSPKSFFQDISPFSN